MIYLNTLKISQATGIPFGFMAIVIFSIPVFLFNCRQLAVHPLKKRMLASLKSTLMVILIYTVVVVFVYAATGSGNPFSNDRFANYTVQVNTDSPELKNTIKNLDLLLKLQGNRKTESGRFYTDGNKLYFSKDKVLKSSLNPAQGKVNIERNIVDAIADIFKDIDTNTIEKTLKN